MPRDLETMPPTLRGWRVDLDVVQRRLLDQTFIDGYRIVGNPDGSITAHHELPGRQQVEICPARFGHTNWNQYGATPAQVARILEMQPVTIDQTVAPGLVDRLARFGWTGHNLEGGLIIRMVPPNHRTYQWRADGTSNNGGAAGAIVGFEVLRDWTTQTISGPLPDGARIELRARIDGGNVAHENRLVRDTRNRVGPQGYAAYYTQTDSAGSYVFPSQYIRSSAQEQAAFEREDVRMRDMQRRLERSVNSALFAAPGPGSSLLETAVGEARAGLPRQDTPDYRGEVAALRAAQEMAQIQAAAEALAQVRRALSPAERQANAEVWLKAEMSQRSTDPLRGKGLGFLDWAAQTYGEYMRKRDGEGD